MKPLHSIFVALFALTTWNVLAAPDISATIILEQYTIVSDTVFKSEQGYLSKSGKLNAVATDFYDVEGVFGIPLNLLEPVSGRPLMNAELFDAYKSLGIIPTWVRSRAVFYLGSSIGYVIVGVKGKTDPNPIPVITKQPESHRVLEGSWAFFNVEATPSAFLTYQWQFKGRALAGETDSWILMDNVGPAQGGIYKVAVSAGGKSVLSKPALLTVAKPVSIKTQPKAQSIKVGKPVTFRVTLAGTAPFNYQWFFNGVDIPGATKSFYTIPKVHIENAGNYGVAVDNGVSATVSESVTLTVKP